MMNPFPIVLTSFHIVLFKQPNWKVGKVKCMTRKLVNDWGHSATLVVKGYDCKAAGWEFKSKLDLLVLMLCEDNKILWL